MVIVLFIVRFMERVWTLWVLGGLRGEVGVWWGGRCKGDLTGLWGQDVWMEDV